MRHGSRPTATVPGAAEGGRVRTQVIAWIPELARDVGAEPSPTEDRHTEPACAAEPVSTARAGGPVDALGAVAVAQCSAGEPSNAREGEGDVVGGDPWHEPRPPAPTASSNVTAAPARSGGRPRLSAPRFPSRSIMVLALTSVVVWGMAWRSERLRLEAQRRGPERLARQPSDGPAATRSIRP